MENKALVPPYGAFKTTFNYILNMVKAGYIPGKIDNTTMTTLSGHNKNEVKAALQFLGLMEEDGTPTDTFRSLIGINDDQRVLVWQRILANAYPSLVGENTGDFDLGTASPGQLRDRFKKSGLSPESIVKAERFFVQAAELANIPISTFIRERQRVGRPTGTSRPKSTSTQPKPTVSTNKPSRTTNQGNSDNAELQGLTFRERKLQEIASLPEFNPEWDIEEKRLWYQQQRFLFSGLLDGQTPDDDEEYNGEEPE